MLRGFKNTLDSITSMIDENGLNSHYVEHEGRFFLRIDQEMCDAGFSCDNIILDVFFDEDEKVLFIGLLRLPKTLRRTGLGSKVMDKIKGYSKQFHFFIYLDAWNESQGFWRRHGFKHIFYDKNMFEIMGYSPDNEDIFHEWAEFKKTLVYKTYLSCHDEEFSVIQIKEQGY